MICYRTKIWQRTDTHTDTLILDFPWHIYIIIYILYIYSLISHIERAWSDGWLAWGFSVLQACWADQSLKSEMHEVDNFSHSKSLYIYWVVGMDLSAGFGTSPSRFLFSSSFWVWWYTPCTQSLTFPHVWCVEKTNELRSCGKKSTPHELPRSKGRWCQLLGWRRWELWHWWSLVRPWDNHGHTLWLLNVVTENQNFQELYKWAIFHSYIK